MSLFSEAFFSFVGRTPRVVSTIDHPFPSPPIHLLDGHRKLYDAFGLDALTVNWDISNPDERRYRYDLVTDTGLLSKNAHLYHYEPGVAYNQQRFVSGPLDLLEQSLPVAAAEIQRRRRHVRTSTDAFIRRALVVVAIARAVSASTSNSADFARGTILAFYRLLGLQKLETFVTTTQMAYSTSPLLTRWIPWCLRNVTGELAFDRLSTAGLFQRAPFRSRSLAGRSNSVSPLSLDAATAIEAGTLIASLDVLLWSLAVAGIQHFGDDRGFFDRLSPLVSIDARRLQLTARGTDCSRFLELAEDIGVAIDITDNAAHASSRSTHATKHTRRSTFGSLFVALGDDLAPLLNTFITNPFPPTTVGYH
jgi:hypothetical protein